MTTVINTPGNGDSSGVGVVVGVIVALALVGLFIVFVLPAIRNNQNPADNTVDVNVKLPADNTNAAQ